MPAGEPLTRNALLDLDTGRLGVARAGHPPPVVARPDGPVEVIEGGGSPPIGWRDATRDKAWTRLQRGSALVLDTIQARDDWQDDVAVLIGLYV